MTNENNAAHPGEDDITARLRENADLDAAEDGNPAVIRLEREAADEIDRLRALLSKLRAPVADERAAERIATLQRMRADYNPSNGPASELKAAALDAAIAALASAPVADTSAIIRDVCELDPADEGPDTVSVTVADLQHIIERHSAPVAGEAHIRELLARWELQRHAANEWADMACNGVQWIRNIRDGISTAEEALENLASNMTHCRETQARAGTEPPAAPQASEAVRDAALEEAATFLERNRSTWVSTRAAFEIRALKTQRAALSAQPGAQMNGGSDAE
ncbi:hypothetical protein LMG26685_02154 [Achromobacter mucicolens]|uniref:hypothetical protein n=1 Tax=Achromobacter mucicolens TaxID=1389922 RepID=UPI0009D423E2|nr:hypothetical protein [Achromobacter mucicolens]OXC91352.1 hypothetical protein BMR85_009575 [Achromobacter sp. KAs 3-5]CAB3643352.1 hypothetical protein LMG26685_02154 [Achromobacter mucicolens]